MVEAASQVGADACKIQTHYGADLSPTFQDRKAHVEGYELSAKEHQLFVKWCESSKVLPVTSVYSDAYCDLLRDAGFTTLKLGSAESMRPGLAQKLILQGFRVWASTGGQHVGELKLPKQTEMIFHCKSKYPHSPYESGLLRMFALRDKFPESKVGFSSHVDPTHPHWALPLEYACLLGAKAIEVHFTLLPRGKTKDGVVSLTPLQLAHICKFDKLPLSEKPIPESFGIWYTKEDEEEKALISHYAKRWSKE